LQRCRNIDLINAMTPRRDYLRGANKSSYIKNFAAGAWACAKPRVYFTISAAALQVTAS
jgi:hypothetical protein